MTSTKPRTKPGKKPSVKPRVSSKAKPAKTSKSAVEKLQQTVLQQRDQIAKLSAENKRLQKELKQKSNGGAGASGGVSGGVSGGMSSKNAASALAAKLGGKVKNKNLQGGSVNTGPKMGGAAAMLAAKLGGKVKNKKMANASAGGVSTGMSPGQAGAALGNLLMKKKKSPTAPTASASGAAAEDTDIFKKYNRMIKMKMGLNSAINRMRQDGMDKKLIAKFEKMHGGGKEESVDDHDPSKFGLSTKKKIKIGKGIKMKRLHWDKIPLKYVQNSIWAQLKEESVAYDPKHFELCFQVRQRKPVVPKSGAGNKSKSNSSGPVEKICFVSKKRSQQVQISMKSLNLSNSQLRDVLHNMDETVMTVDQLGKLMDIVPSMDEQTDAEKKIMQDGTRNASDYGIVEEFFFHLCDFYHLQQRLKLWMFKQNFKEICDSLLQQYKSIGKACDRVRNSKNFRQLLTIVLVFGNHMNSGTRKGECYGFNLKILKSLNAVKSFDNTRSLLMYIYEFCDRKYPKVLKMLPELGPVVKKSSQMEIDTLQRAYQRIQENMKEIKDLVESDEVENYDMDDRFIGTMTKFHKSTQSKMKKFNMTVGNVNVSTKRLMKKFAFGTEDEPQSIEELFKTLHQFLEDFQKSREKLIKLEKERQKRIMKRKKQREKQRAKGKTGGKSNKPPVKMNPGQHNGSAQNKPALKAKAKPFTNMKNANKVIPGNNSGRKPAVPKNSGRFTPTPMMAAINDDEELKLDDEDPDNPFGVMADSNTFLSRDSSLHAEIKKQVEFEKRKMSVHSNLRGHIRERSRFVSTGGQLTPDSSSSTMRRLSSMYQQTQDEVRSIEEARKKAAVLKYNKFRLPPLKKKNASSYYSNMRTPTSPLSGRSTPQRGQNARHRANTPAFAHLNPAESKNSSPLPDGDGIKAPPRQQRAAARNMPMAKAKTKTKPKPKPKTKTNGTTSATSPAPNNRYNKSMPSSPPNKPALNGNASHAKSNGSKSKHSKKSSKHKNRHKSKKHGKQSQAQAQPQSNGYGSASAYNNSGGPQKNGYANTMGNMPPPPPPQQGGGHTAQQMAQMAQMHAAQQQQQWGSHAGSAAYNPQNAYTQQAQQLGYGSIPNFGYQQYQQQQQQQNQQQNQSPYNTQQNQRGYHQNSQRNNY